MIGNTATLNSKLKYYDTIRIKAGKHSLIDLEIGAFSRPLTSSERKLMAYRSCFASLFMLEFFQGKY